MDRPGPGNKTIRDGEPLKFKSHLINLSSENFLEWGTPLHAELYEVPPIEDASLNLSSQKFKPKLTLNLQPLLNCGEE